MSIIHLYLPEIMDLSKTPTNILNFDLMYIGDY